mgnify:CR=1 FL=1
MNSNAKIGLFGTGLDTYWGQFDGLLDELKGYQARIRDRMERDAGVQVADAGMVDSPARALEAASLFAREQVDLVFLYMATYCLSSTILPVVQRLNCPVVVLNLQPTPAIDYERLNALGDRGRMTGMWLANCQACSAPEIASVLARSHRRCAFVTGWLDDPVAWRQIGEWIAAAGVCAGMRRNRLGVLGHYYGGMLDVYTDLTRQSAVFGTHVELLEMCELHALREQLCRALRPQLCTLRENLSILSVLCRSTRVVPELLRAVEMSGAPVHDLMKSGPCVLMLVNDSQYESSLRAAYAVSRDRND